jgi:hypothetical protein
MTTVSIIPRTTVFVPVALVVLILFLFFSRYSDNFSFFDLVIIMTLQETTRTYIIMDTPKTRLAVLAIFKNEADILDEWLQHYLREGVTRFYLIDNGSDDGFRDILARYDPDVVRWHTDNRRHAQIGIYNDELVSRIRPDADEWLLVCDLDEFVYTPRPGDTIAGFLSGVSPDVGDIWMKWLMFGSAGHKEQPAEGVIAGFQWRARAPVPHAYTDCWKSIVRITALDVLEIHPHRMGPSYVTMRFDADSEEAVAMAPLRLNHYAIQSFDRFCRVKMVRGDAQSPESDAVRDHGYFERYDFHDVLDDGLHKKSASLPALNVVRIVRQVVVGDVHSRTDKKEMNTDTDRHGRHDFHNVLDDGLHNKSASLNDVRIVHQVVVGDVPHPNPAINDLIACPRLFNEPFLN